jgi:hypothetical protein
MEGLEGLGRLRPRLSSMTRRIPSRSVSSRTSVTSSSFPFRERSTICSMILDLETP